MAKNSYMLRNVEDFAPGAFENTAMQDGAIHLGSVAGEYLQSGCYTSVVFTMAPFTRLVPSWSAATPPGTAVEVQVRLASGKGGWSRWFGFGKWSPFLARASAVPYTDGAYQLDAEKLIATDYSACPEMVQVRVYLYSDNKKKTPTVSLLGISSKGYRGAREDNVVCEKNLEIPAYSCLGRDPAIAGRMPGATTVAMLLNRFGEDLLPEEVARFAYDQTAGRYGNLSFLAAVGGAYGYACEVHYAGINFLRAQVRSMHAVGALVAYSAPDVHPAKAEEAAQGSVDKPPVWEKAVAGSNGHLVAVCGFFTADDGTKMLRMHNPLVHSNEDVRCDMPVEEFLKYYLGVAFTAKKGVAKSDEAKPLRFMGHLQVQDNEVSLFYKLKKVFPMDAENDKMFAAGTICYTLTGRQAWASAAQKRFYYPTLTNGKLVLDVSVEEDQRLTLYCICPTGITWVGEKSL